MKLSNKFIFILCSAAFIIQGCTNLDEKVYDSLPVDQFGQTPSQLNALIAPIYRTLKGYSPNDFFLLSECSSDMAITPTRKGGDWWDGGQFKELRYHTWTPNTSLVVNSYNDAMSGISTCNKIYALINERENIANKDQILAEIRGVRAFWYYVLLDFYGNVPLVTDFNDTSLPSNTPRKDIYKFVLDELNAIKNIVRSDVSSSSYGKMTKGVVYTLLAKMYLNAMVWNPDGGPKWQECADACDTVMKLPYIIEPNFRTNFAVHNEISKEIIFPIVFSTADGGNNIHYRTLHYLDPIALNLKVGTWNGISAMPPYVKAYDPNDKRIAWSFLIGEMKDPATGNVLITAHGRPLIHTIDITMKYNIDNDGWGQVEQEEGARCYKWEFESGLSGDMENDIAIFRLADVYLMKAEALVRLGKNNDEATQLVNTIRARAFDSPSKLKSSVTLDDIYQERRFELAWEAFGRQDQIRFGTFLDAIPGWKATDKDAHTLIFPIPQEALDANNKLKQNPGY
jgi:hypothetical protein